MSRKTTLYCDICGIEIKDCHSEVHINMTEVRQCNIMISKKEDLHYKDCCYYCRGSILDLIEELKRGINE